MTPTETLHDPDIGVIEPIESVHDLDTPPIIHTETLLGLARFTHGSTKIKHDPKQTKPPPKQHLKIMSAQLAALT